MKHFSPLTLVLVFLSSSLFADQFIIKSFKKLDNKILTNSQKVYDDNDELCAIILVRTSLIDLGISASTPIVGSVRWEEGDYRVHVTAGTRMIKFFKKGFETIEYTFPQAPEGGNFYLLELEYKRTDIVATGNTMGFVLINSVPEGADVYINEEATGQQTPYYNTYSEGFHRFSLKKELYHDYEGNFTIKPNENTKLDLSLRPNFGKLNISTTPEQGAQIYVDGIMFTQKSPTIIDYLANGNHTLSIRLNLYETYQQDFPIT